MKRSLTALTSMLLAASSLAVAQTLGRPISGYPTSTALTGAETVVGTQAGVTATVPVSQIKAYAVSSASIQAALGYTPLRPSNNLSDLSMAAMARTNLGLGSSSSVTFGALALANGGIGAASSALANSIRLNITGNDTIDYAQGAIVVPSGGSPLTGYNAVAGYVQNNYSAGAGAVGNGVALYGVSAANCATCSVWGENTLTVDTLNPNSSSTVSGVKTIGYEADIATSSPNTTIQGFSLIYEGWSQPAYAGGYSCSTQIFHSFTAQFNNCFASVDGAVLNGGAAISLGSQAAAATANDPSQTISWTYHDGVATRQNYSMHVMSNGQLYFTGTAASPNWTFNGQVNVEGDSVIGPLAISGTNIASNVHDFNYFNSSGVSEIYSMRANSAGNFIFTGSDTVGNGKVYSFDGPIIATDGFVRPGLTTYASLSAFDASPQVGDQGVIADASACTVNTAVAAGGGTTHSCPVIYNGADWVALVTH